MIIQTINQISVKKWKLVQIFTTEKDSEDNFKNKGYHLHTGLAEEVGKGHQRYFLKFVIMNHNNKEMETAKNSLERELKFQLRHPNVVYVMQLEEMTVLSEESDFEKEDLFWLSERCRSSADEPLKILCMMEEYADGMDLETYYSKNASAVSEEQMFRHMIELIYGMCGYYSRYRKDPLLHRDIKPTNVIIRKSDQTLLYIDFDLSHSSGSMKTQTGKNMLGGTPGYADPRQPEVIARKSDIYMDIYSLGMVFLYMMTGDHYVKAAGEYSNSDMFYWRYLEDERGFLYTVKRSFLKRNSTPVFQDTKYDKLIHIINRMISEDISGKGENSRYGSPQDILIDFRTFINEYYGMDKMKLFREKTMLNRLIVQSDPSQNKDAYVQFYSQNGFSRIVTIEENQVRVLVDDYEREFLVLNNFGGNIYIHFIGQNTVSCDADLEQVNILTEQNFYFTIGKEKYSIRKIQFGQ